MIDTHIRRITTQTKTWKHVNMKSLELSKNLKRLSNAELKLYTGIIRKQLIEDGFDHSTIDKSIKKAVQTFKAKSTLDLELASLLGKTSEDQNPRDKRGLDSIGRILVEYCFIRIPTKKMIWPIDSDEDQLSRSKFVRGVIPRPLMHSFLISVRGAIPELDGFETGSVLFGEENQKHEERKAYVSSLVKKFQNKKADHKEVWNTIYSDKRFQKAALDLIGDIRRKIVEFGLERYVRILENLRQRDPYNKTTNIMPRPFLLEDVKQIDDALWDAEEKISQKLE